MDDAAAERLAKALAHEADAHGIHALDHEQRNVVVAWWAYGELSNGGFRVFFEGAYPLTETARSFRALGLEAVADACGQVVAALFPGGEPLDLRARSLLVSDVDWTRFRPHLKRVYALGWEGLIRAIGSYVDAHPAAFGLPRV